MSKLPVYQSSSPDIDDIKALKIGEVLPGAEDGFYGPMLIPVLPNHAPIGVSSQWAEVHKPQAGGYFVIGSDSTLRFFSEEKMKAGFSLKG